MQKAPDNLLHKSDSTTKAKKINQWIIANFVPNYRLCGDKCPIIRRDKSWTWKVLLRKFHTLLLKWIKTFNQAGRAGRKLNIAARLSILWIIWKRFKNILLIESLCFFCTLGPFGYRQTYTLIEIRFMMG